MTKVHLPRPSTGGLLTNPLPLFCGRARDLDTHTTSFPHRATCERCIAAHQRYTEESDYQLARAKRAAESEREAGVADRVHYSKNTTPGLTGLARAICGQWSEQVTDNTERVTCLTCKRILHPSPKSNPNPNKTESRPMTMTRFITAALFLAVAACDTLPLTATPIDTPDSIKALGIGQFDELDEEPDGLSDTSDDSGSDESTSGSESTGIDEPEPAPEPEPDPEFDENDCPGAPCSVDADCDPSEAKPGYTYMRCVDSVCRKQCIPPFWTTSCGQVGSYCAVDAEGNGTALCNCEWLNPYL